MPNALIVDDNKLTLRYLRKLLEGEGFTVKTAGSFQEAAAELREGVPDLLLVDLVLPDGPGIDLIRGIESRSAVEVVVITGHGSADSVVQALHLGASDYLTKPIDEKRLKSIVRNVLRIRGLQLEVGDLQKKLRRFGSFGSLIGNSSAMENVYDLIAKVAPTDATVFVVGESGSGKEVVARTIHEFSHRRAKPFLPINCGAISPQLIESELFGHEEGSFTGAVGLHRGNFERADGGTLFLDEIAEMPVELQVKLLRVLETGIITRIGGDEQIQVAVRVIAATNRSPTEAVADRHLREDLFYRLNVFSMQLPPLREHKEDIDLLAAHFLSELNRAEGTAKHLSSDFVRLLRRYHWPGNVRELKNVMHRAFIVASDEILPNCLPPEIQENSNGRTSKRIVFEVGTPLEEIERQSILATFEHFGGNKKKTAEMLRVNLRTLYNRLKAYQANGAGERSPRSGGKT